MALIGVHWSVPVMPGLELCIVKFKHAHANVKRLEVDGFIKGMIRIGV